MTRSESPALSIAVAYHNAWTGNQFDEAMSYIAEDIVCQSPGGEIKGKAAFREFMGPFSQTLTSASILSAFGDENTALVMYDTATIVVDRAPAAEFIRVKDGLIVEMRIIFDRLPFVEAERLAAQSASS